MSLGSFMDMNSVSNIGALPGQGTHHTDTWPGFGKKLAFPLRGNGAVLRISRPDPRA